MKGTKPESGLCEIIERISRSDEHGLAELYDRTSPLVFGLALRILNDNSSAQDVTQEVYLQVWRDAARYEARRGAPLTWLITIARTRAIDFLRSTKKHDDVEPLDSHVDFADGSLSAEDRVAANGRQAIISAALKLLSPAQRQAIELSFYAGLSHSEIASKLKQPIGTVKNHIRLGMLRLRDGLQSRRGDL
jgi:RNA polymerase sigma-70 factor (ECF subfamily)